MKDCSLLKVTEAQYAGGYCLRLKFNNGATRLMDFTPFLDKGICRKLRDMDYFRSFRLDPFTVDWNDEIVFAPEYLYERSVVS